MNRSETSESRFTDALWVRFAPKLLRDRITGKHESQAIIANTGWLAADKILRIAIGVPVSIWMTRYLGPEDFGQIAYALAFVAIFGAIASAGLDAIVIRELVVHSDRSDGILASAFCIKAVCGVTALATSLGVVLLTNPGDKQVFGLVAIIGLTLLTQAFDVVEYWFQSHLRSRYVVMARIAALMTASGARIIAITVNAPLAIFALMFVAEAVLGTAFCWLSFRKRQNSPARFHPQLAIAKSLMHQGWPLLVAALAVVLYMRIDALMLQSMAGTKATGIYAAATRLSELWYAVPTVLISSLSPALLRTHAKDRDEFLRKLHQLYASLAWLSIVIAIPMTFFATPIVEMIYGKEFAASGPVLAIHLWAALPVFLGIASSQYLLAERLQHISLLRTAIGLATNIMLNLLLIPQYEAAGAAVATVLSYYVATFSLIFFRASRRHALDIARAPFSRH